MDDNTEKNETAKGGGTVTERNNGSEKVTLWTRQDIKSLAEIKNKGFYRVRREFIEQQYEDIAGYFIKLYGWFVEAAEKRVQRPEGVVFPVWCSVSEKYMMRPEPGTVCYVLSVEKKDILYFDSIKWDWVLNHRYIPRDEKDAEEYSRDIKAKGFPDESSFIEGRYSRTYPDEKERVMDSWVRIFEIDEWDPFRVQANIWEIRKDQILQVIHYDPQGL